MLWTTIRSVHLLAMAFFVGGQLLLAIAVVPAARQAANNGQLQLIARRFGIGTLIAIGVLLTTGAMLASHYFRWNDPTLHMKMLLAVVVGVLIIWHLRRPTNHVVQAVIFIVSLVLVWLGVSLAH